MKEFKLLIARKIKKTFGFVLKYPGGEGGTSFYGLYRYVKPQRV